MDDGSRARLRQQLLGIVYRLDNGDIGEDYECETVGLLGGCFVALLRSTDASKENAIEIIRRSWPDESSD